MISQLGRFGELPIALSSNIAESKSIAKQYPASIGRSRKRLMSIDSNGRKPITPFCILHISVVFKSLAWATCQAQDMVIRVIGGGLYREALSSMKGEKILKILDYHYLSWLYPDLRLSRTCAGLRGLCVSFQHCYRIPDYFKCYRRPSTIIHIKRLHRERKENRPTNTER